MSDIIFGDCLAHMRTMSSACIDLVLTDPPYEIDDMTPYFTEFLRLLKPSGSLYVFGDKNMIANRWFAQLERPQKELLIWYYKNSPKPKGRWRMSMQAIIYLPGEVFNEDEARIEYQPATKKLHGRIRPSSGRLDKCSAYDTSKGALPRDVIEHPALTGHLSRERLGHSDQKPFGLIEKLVRTSSNPNDIVLDAFAGTGTVSLACLKNDRRYIAIEKDEYWYNKILERLE